MSDPQKENKSLKQFDKAKFLALETYRKNGETIRTTTFFAKFDGLLFISTTSNTGKVKRLRSNNKVRVVPSDFSGHVKGEWLDGSAKQVDNAEEINRVNHLLNKQHPILRRLRAITEIFSNAKRLVYSIETDGSKRSAAK
ncbi:MAG: PPOX class F420-dependent oxidoreductase [Thaumarchaeota archaeon]|nr:PPOX class F420-dependent oxidoreductase [Nitrososphaerota archaeon]